MSSQSENLTHPCIKKLQILKAQVEHNMQTKENANCINKYRVQFEVTQPSNLVGGEMKQHQLEALEWMINLASQQANGILADDMGMGKTIQAISYLAYLREENGIRGKHLVICPKSVQSNWLREINKWFPSCKAVMLLNTEQQRQACLKQVVEPRKFDILVTTFQGVKKCIYKLSRINWEALIVDEAHKIKNAETQNFQALSYLKATFKLLLTGTPLNNNLKELWCLLNFVMPHIFHDPGLFQEIEEAALTFQGTQQEKLDFQLKVAKYFHRIIDPYFKRRTKKDLELGLPPKIEKTLFVPLSRMQLQMYRNYLKFGSVYGQGHKVNRHSMISRKICLHPYLFEDMWPIEEAEFGEHAIENCGKLKVVDKLLKKLLSEGHKVLLFSQFTIFLDIFDEYCGYRGFRTCRLDGNTTLQQRQEYMHDFNNTDKYQIFLLSTRAGGLGINLIGADRVIIYDIDWNPQNDIQAMDRAYRIGQKSPVHVYKLITEHTIEERVSDLQRYKLVWDELVIQKGAFMSKKPEDPFGNVSLQMLNNIGKGDIFRLQVEQNDRNIQEILMLAEEKDRKRQEQIRNKLKDNINLGISKFNPYQEEQQVEQTYPQSSDVMTIVKRRNYEQQKRERTKFERMHTIPAYKFYVQAQKIREIEFEIYMELKQEVQNKDLLSHLETLLQKAKKVGKFDNWSEEEFNTFVDAHQLYLKEDYEHIAAAISTKTPEEVKEYSQYFFEKAPNNERLTDELKKINLGQVVVKMKLKNRVDQNLSDIHSLLSNNQSDESYKERKQDLYKTQKQLYKQIGILKKMEREKAKLIEKAKVEEEKQKKHEQKAIEKEEKRKREEEKQQKAAKQKEEKEKKAEQQRILKEQREADKIRKAQEREQLVHQRQEKKKKQEEEREHRQKLREKEKIRKQQEKLQALETSKAKKLEAQSSNLLKKIERDSASSKTKNSNESKQTRKKVSQTSYKMPDPLEKALQIVTIGD